MLLSSVTVFTFRNYISGTVGMPFLFPSIASLAGLAGIALLLSLITISAAVFLPAYRISQQEPALAMRE
jgi:ABC-type lipoprotein release transport system permease subunit